MSPTQVCCGAERVCKFLPLVRSTLRMTTKRAKPDESPASRSVLTVWHCYSSCGSSLWLENFADFWVFLMLSLQSWKQVEINFYRALKGLWNKLFDTDLNISLCLNEFCLAVQRKNDSFWFLQLLAWLTVNTPDHGMLIHPFPRQNWCCSAIWWQSWNRTTLLPFPAQVIVGVSLWGG